MKDSHLQSEVLLAKLPVSIRQSQFLILGFNEIPHCLGCWRSPPERRPPSRWREIPRSAPLRRRAIPGDGRRGAKANTAVKSHLPPPKRSPPPDAHGLGVPPDTPPPPSPWCRPPPPPRGQGQRPRAGDSRPASGGSGGQAGGGQPLLLRRSRPRKQAARPWDWQPDLGAQGKSQQAEAQPQRWMLMTFSVLQGPGRCPGSTLAASRATDRAGGRQGSMREGGRPRQDEAPRT